MWQDDVFQVERYEIVIAVRPTPKEEVRVRHGAKQRLVRCDNRAEIRREVHFAHSNSCSDLNAIRLSRNFLWG